MKKINSDELVKIGARFRASYLVEQAGYTLGVAAYDGESLSDLLPEKFLEKTKDLLEKLRAALNDKELMEEESKEATREQNLNISRAKVWRRKVVKRAQRAERLGESLPDGLLSVGRIYRIPDLQKQIDVMLSLLFENASKLHGKGIDDLLKEGKEIANSFKESDAEQEVKRFRALPDKVKEFYEKKAQLYLHLKAINDAGMELWASQPILASKYNLSILHRNYGRKKEEEKKEEEKKQ